MSKSNQIKWSKQGIPLMNNFDIVEFITETSESPVTIEFNINLFENELLMELETGTTEVDIIDVKILHFAFLRTFLMDYDLKVLRSLVESMISYHNDLYNNVPPTLAKTNAMTIFIGVNYDDIGSDTNLEEMFDTYIGRIRHLLVKADVLEYPLVGWKRGLEATVAKWQVICPTDILSPNNLV